MDIIIRDNKFLGLHKSAALLITDEKQLDIIIESPTKPIAVEDDRGYSLENKALYEDADSLLDKVRKAKESGAQLLEVSYDFFFGGTKRTLFPDSEKTIQAFKIIHDVAKEYGMGFSASIINPLDTGGEYIKTHEDTGFTWQYREGAISLEGNYSVDLDRQRQWTNNKGPIELKLVKLVVFAFKEERLGNSSYYFVDPDEILNISDSAAYTSEDHIEISPRGYGRSKMTIAGHWEGVKAGYNRCLAVAVYQTQEIDYFAEGAFNYMKSIIDKHAQAGITYQGFYSDEMHIQFDWGVDSHFGLDEVTTRYLTSNVVKEYARLYGKEFEDFPKYLVYLSYHQHGFLSGEEAGLPAQHVMGKSPEGVYRTWLFRKRYFELLNERVVGLCIDVKQYAENLFGAPIICRGHATWVESPALDRNYPEARFSLVHDENYSRYDYHPVYYYSSSVVEALAGCYNYFTWNDFYTGGGTDHGEDGYSDRNYYTQAFGISLAELNPFQYGYAGGWGSPEPVMRRFHAVGKAYGIGSWRDDYGERIVQGIEARITDVLALYPLDLVYVEERFGSWMVQYGYCNYITEDKLLQFGSVSENGKLKVKNREYQALVVFFSPFINAATLQLLEDFVKAGGKLLWMSMPPALEPGGKEISQNWGDLFGIKPVLDAYNGIRAGGRSIAFEAETGLEPMPILSNLLPDHVYPVELAGARQIANLDGEPVGSMRSFENGGWAVYAGFRVRDDQSQSTGRDISTLFDLLNYMGAYTPGGGEAISRPASSQYVINRFRNGTVSVANHYRTFHEHWDGLYFRDDKKDEEYLAGRELPPIEIEFSGKELFGHTISYSGTDTLTYRLDGSGNLIGFAGSNSNSITIDGRFYRFKVGPDRLVWSVVDNEQLAEGVKSAILMRSDQAGRVTLPDVLKGNQLNAGYCKTGIFSPAGSLEVTASEGIISIDVSEAAAGHWILIYSN